MHTKFYIKTSHIFRYVGSAGTFTAQRAGLYFFAVAFEVDHDVTEGTFYIQKNRVAQCYARGDGGGEDNGGAEANASCAAVIEMQAGDVVNVYSKFVDQIESPSECNFSGFLIRAYA